MLINNIVKIFAKSKQNCLLLTLLNINKKIKYINNKKYKNFFIILKNKLFSKYIFLMNFISIFYL